MKRSLRTSFDRFTFQFSEFVIATSEGVYQARPRADGAHFARRVAFLTAMSSTIPLSIRNLTD
jgi:hypothetical protein